jgi:Transposase DDE domain
MKFSNEIPDITSITDTLCDYFDEDRIEKEAKDTNFIQKPKQLTGISFFSICIMQGFGSSLGIMCGALCCFNVTMCEQSLNERFSKNAVVFMKRLFDQMLELELSKSVSMNFLNKFTGVFIQDATTIKMPDSMVTLFKGSGGNATKSSIKIDFQMDLQDTGFQMEIRGGTSADSSQPVRNPQKGALYLRDLGYFNISFFLFLIEAGAYFLSRLKSNINVYKDIKGKVEIDLYSLSKKMKANETIHIPVFLGHRKYVPTFLILQKLPPEIIEIKVERVKKDYKRRENKLTKKSLEWCEFNSYVTNIPIDWYSPLILIKIYSIRWQIEIMFKVWKSIFKISDVGKIHANRALCMLYGRLIWILLQMKLFRVYKKNIYGVSEKEVSELTAYKQMNEYKPDFRLAVKSGQEDKWKVLILFLFKLIQSFAIKKNRKEKVPPLYIIDFKSVM